MDTLINMADDSSADASDNQGAMTREGIMRRAVTCGSAEGKGGNSRPMLAFYVVEAAKAGVLKLDKPTSKGKTAGTKLDDAQMIWDRFSRACAAAQSVGFVKLDSAKQQESKLRSFIKLGSLPHVDGNRVMSRARDIMEKAREANGGKPLVKSAFDGYLSVARAQVALSPDVEFDDAQIEAALSPAPKADPTEADRLDTIYKAAEKLAEDDETPVKDETKEMLERVLVEIGARIKELGGTTSEIKNREKAAQKAAELQAKAAALLVRV